MKRPRKKAGRAGKAAGRKAALPSGRDAGLEAAMDASAKMLGLTIRKGWRPSVLANLKATMQHASRVTEFDLPEDIEPAPVFKA